LKILVFGGNGMAGHMIVDYLTEATSNEVFYTIRGRSDEACCCSLDVTDEQSVEELLKQINPEVVVNAAGLLNDDAALRIPEAIYVNGLFPQKLSRFGLRYGFRVVHISTDCVFTGARGNYTEKDTKDGTTIYAKTKSLGELIDDINITIRTSIIGPELKKDGIGLFHWVMRQSGKVSGYQHVYWNGVTTLELAKAIEWLLPRSLTGLIHLTGTEKVSKLELLKLIKEEFKHDGIDIQAYGEVRSDKSLVNTRPDFAYLTPGYSEMLGELKLWMDSGKKRVYPYV
jgi:dTDP-4-dehydrorhamnose reductase